MAGSCPAIRLFCCVVSVSPPETFLLFSGPRCFPKNFRRTTNVGQRPFHPTREEGIVIHPEESRYSHSSRLTHEHFFQTGCCARICSRSLNNLVCGLPNHERHPATGRPVQNLPGYRILPVSGKFLALKVIAPQAEEPLRFGCEAVAPNPLFPTTEQPALRRRLAGRPAPDPASVRASFSSTNEKAALPSGLFDRIKSGESTAPPASSPAFRPRRALR